MKWNKSRRFFAWMLAGTLMLGSGITPLQTGAAGVTQGTVRDVLDTIGTDIAQMFDSSDDNTWLFGGGIEVQGRFSEVGGARNYVGQFEEYIRYVKGNATPQMRQRHMINVGKSGADITEFAEKLDDYIQTLEPKAVDYLIGREDYSRGRDGIDTFKDGLASVIHKATAMKNNGGYAVIQLPHAVKDASANANIQLYIDAAKEVIRGIDSASLSRVVLADHYTQTNNDSFKNSKLNGEDLLNMDGHYEFAKQLAAATFKSTDKFPAFTKWTEKASPDTYVDAKPTVAAEGGSLTVSVPCADSSQNEWTYILTIAGTEISGMASGNPFTIEELPENADYELIVRTADGEAQYEKVAGRIAEGSEDTGAQLSELQQAIRSRAEGDEPLTWLFMGDSITHACVYTYGYDGIAQIFEKYIKEDLGRTDDIVINTGNSSATTTVTLENIRQRLTKYTPDIVFIMLGTNDAGIDDTSSAGVDSRVLSQYKENLERILGYVDEANPDALVVFRSPTPVNGGQWEHTRKFENGYLDTLKTVALENNRLYVDQYTDWRKEFEAYPYLFGNQYYYGNFLHPGAAGQLWMAQKLIRECGLRTDTRIGSLSYEFNYSDIKSSIVPSVVSAQNSVVISKGSLQKAYGGETLQDMTVVLTDTQTGKTYTRSSGLEGSRAAVTNLPTDRTYRVDVSAMAGGSTAKRVTFASQEVTLRNGQEIQFDVTIAMEQAPYIQDTAEGSQVGILSVDELAPQGTWTYSLVSGEGAAYNAFFQIEGNTLKVKRTLQNGKEYSIRIKAQSGSDVTETVYVLRTLPTLASARKEAADAFTADQTGLDIDVSGVNFDGNTSVDLGDASDAVHYADGAYLQVLNKLKESSTGGTILFRFCTTSNGTIFGAGSSLQDDGSNMIFGVQNGQFRNFFRIASGNGLKGNQGSGIADGNTHTAALSFDTGIPGCQNQVVMSVDGGANIYNPAWWTEAFKTWFNRNSQEITKFEIGGVDYNSATGLGAFNGSIDFVTITDKIYNETELRAITGEQTADQPEVPETVLIEGEQKLSVGNGQIKVSEGAWYTASALTWEEDQSSAFFTLTAEEGYVFSGDIIFDILIPEEMECQISDIQILDTSVRVTLMKKKQPGAEEREKLNEALQKYAGELSAGAGLYEEDSFAAFRKVYEDAQAAIGRGEKDTAVLNALLDALTDARAKLQKKTAAVSNPPIPGNNAENSVKKGDSVTVKGIKYVVLDSQKKTAAAAKGIQKKAGKVTIAAVVKVKGVECRVTQIKTNAFKKYANLKTLNIGANVTKIGSRAFYLCRKLKRINFKGKKVPSTGRQAFAKVSGKVKIKAPKLLKKQRKTLIKRLKKAGIPKKAIS